MAEVQIMYIYINIFLLKYFKEMFIKISINKQIPLETTNLKYIVN